MKVMSNQRDVRETDDPPNAGYSVPAKLKLKPSGTMRHSKDMGSEQNRNSLTPTDLINLFVTTSRINGEMQVRQS